MYDRTLLIATAQAMGDRTSADMTRRLGIARTTGWRLWTGRHAPSAALAAAVERHYGLSARHLVKRTAA